MDSFAKNNGPRRWTPLMMFPVIVGYYKSRCTWLRLSVCQRMEKQQITDSQQKGIDHQSEMIMLQTMQCCFEGGNVLLNILRGYGEY